MKWITASRLTYDADIGRIEPGGTYYVDDTRAERWVVAGIGVEGSAPPSPPPPPPEPEDEGDEEPETEDEEEDEDGGDPAELAAKARGLHDAGDSERTIAGKLGISRSRVHTLLKS